MTSIAERRKKVVPTQTKLSIVKQCKVLGISRSGYYYAPSKESALNMDLMELMDKQYLKRPYYGAGRMHTWLTKDKGYKVSLNRIERLYYKVMGLRSLMPGPHTSKPGKGKGHTVFPYLLRGLKINRPNQVWAMDITYIPMNGGFMYLCAVIDVYSRYVLSWSISNTMESSWCKEALERAVSYYGKPEIINTDQGAQFTANVFTSYIKNLKTTRLSMDGKGRAIDNVFIERFWRSIKYEDIYLRKYENGSQLFKGIEAYMNFYNNTRRHERIGKVPPTERFFSLKTSLQPLIEEASTEKNQSYFIDKTV